MKNIETSIMIEAPIETVWEAFVDFELYPQWNPFMTITGSVAIGEKLEIQIEINAKKMVIHPKVVAFEAYRRLEWKGTIISKRVFGGHHYFHFKPISEYQTEFVHGENFSGILRHAILLKVGKSTEQGFLKMNEAFKNRAEERVI